MSNPHRAQAPVWHGAWPAAGGRLVIALHGRGHTPADILAVATRAAPGLPVLAPAAEAQRWYPQRFMAPRADNQPWLDDALAMLDHWVAEAARRGIAPEHIVWLGFSQGACLACEYVWRRPRRWGALLCFTGGLIGEAGTLDTLPPAALHGLPALFTNGDADPWVPLSRSRESADALRAAGAQVHERVYAARDHTVLDDEIAAAAALLRLQQSFDR